MTKELDDRIPRCERKVLSALDRDISKLNLGTLKKFDALETRFDETIEARIKISKQ